MSFDIALCRPGTAIPVEVSLHEEGGTYAIGGTNDAELNVTYNYARYFPWRDLDGKTGAETETLLRAACAELGTTRDPDYWAATPGNAGHALSVLLGWAEAHPDGVWRVW